MKGQNISLPQGYIGLVIQQQEGNQAGAGGEGVRRSAHDDDDELNEEGISGQGRGQGDMQQQQQQQPGKRWSATRSFSSINLWGHDTLPTRSDPSRRVMDYLSFASKVQKTVTADKVAAEMDIAVGKP